jgi:hypothetical protein
VVSGVGSLGEECGQPGGMATFQITFPGLMRTLVWPAVVVSDQLQWARENYNNLVILDRSMTFIAHASHIVDMHRVVFLGLGKVSLQ